MIQAKATKALKKAFDGKLADVVSDILVISREENLADRRNYKSRAMVDGFTFEEVAKSAGSITINDKKLVIIQDELNCSPKVGWQVKLGSIDYRIHHIKHDPSSTIWEIVVRN